MLVQAPRGAGRFRTRPTCFDHHGPGDIDDRRTEMLLASALLAGASASSWPGAPRRPPPPRLRSPDARSAGEHGFGPGVSPAPSASRSPWSSPTGRSRRRPPTWPSRRREPVHLTVTSDVADEVHVHGYDIEQDGPGRAAP